MVKLVVYFKRRAGMEVEPFQECWRTRHAEVVSGLPGIRRYVQSHTLLAGYRKGAPAFDGVAAVAPSDARWCEGVRVQAGRRGRPSGRARRGRGPSRRRSRSCRGAPPRARARAQASRVRSSRRMILPVLVFGTSSTNCTARGAL